MLSHCRYQIHGLKGGASCVKLLKKDSDSEEEGKWSEDLEDFGVKSFDPSDSGYKVQIPNGSEALFSFTMIFGEDTINNVLTVTNKVVREKLAGNETRLQQWCDIPKPEFKAYLGLLYHDGNRCSSVSC